MKRCLVLAAALAAFALPSFAQEEGASQETPPRPVKLITLDAGENRLQRQFFGRLQARETVDLAFQVSGQIVKFPVQEGAQLAAGELVAQLDLTRFERQLRQAEINLDKARRDLERLEELSSSSASEVQIQNARTEYELAQVSVEEAENALDDATLEANFDALVARREVANYTTVNAGTPVVRLHDMSELRVDIDVPEVLFRRATAEDTVQFHASFPSLEETYELELRELEAETADVAQTFRITLAFTNEVPPRLLPGASVTVTATAIEDPGNGDIVVPETALVFSPDRQPGVMVFVPEGDGADRGTVARTPVEIAMREDAHVRVTGGIEPGTVIVAAGASQLRDGQEVRRFTGLGE
ncbi:efflux RND transporter periplasmic adaptor subunit [Allosediminivita pacifica]|uniref:RND family efflux transporter MFP subunit n=1 Tax=Allosediminivita pacifica TaxID=1267769 RepID=A0A2T6A6E6_9RHOB|nr:efflux RND transporter periplasmic adaptor subunit [Allosediminivita pacifica]PTX39394.1 RND family efflux transporter MFP subunit [Allosediminivita pacifica]GGB28067.1 hemolysin secretion protein D [Allosediminivita pacifica]